jgi:hypothetical protein
VSKHFPWYFLLKYFWSLEVLRFHNGCWLTANLILGFCTMQSLNFLQLSHMNNKFLLPNYFIIHVNQIHSPWRQWQHIPPKFNHYTVQKTKDQKFTFDHCFIFISIKLKKGKVQFFHLVICNTENYNRSSTLPFTQLCSLSKNQTIHNNISERYFNDT